jgi:hypothetical protein
MKDEPKLKLFLRTTIKQKLEEKKYIIIRIVFEVETICVNK